MQEFDNQENALLSSCEVFEKEGEQMTLRYDHIGQSVGTAAFKGSSYSESYEANSLRVSFILDLEPFPFMALGLLAAGSLHRAKVSQSAVLGWQTIGQEAALWPSVSKSTCSECSLPSKGFAPSWIQRDRSQLNGLLNLWADFWRQTQWGWAFLQQHILTHFERQESRAIKARPFSPSVLRSHHGKMQVWKMHIHLSVR